VSTVAPKYYPEPVAPLPALATPDPALTKEAFAALAAVVVPALLVLFKLDVTDSARAAIIGALGSVYAAFMLWHAARVRAARALAKGLSAGGSATVKP